MVEVLWSCCTVWCGERVYVVLSSFSGRVTLVVFIFHVEVCVLPLYGKDRSTSKDVDDCDKESSESKVTTDLSDWTTNDACEDEG